MMVRAANHKSNGHFPRRTGMIAEGWMWNLLPSSFSVFCLWVAKVSKVTMNSAELLTPSVPGRAHGPVVSLCQKHAVPKPPLFVLK